ncbi:zinc finger protein ZAT4-like [Cornus florida]|uniref:zinc finger protein ZAT4-like n=1 Tax=Cornus florida TaxID=4283 RepID=UPI002898901D|nr:zinc finger protein ZAT4-like [Cornus florida]
MEEDQHMKLHVCKFCNKSFPCGRSLGGHMRSHLINSADHQTDGKLTKKKLSSVKNGGNKANNATVYGLRDNPKKTCKFADSSDGTTLLHDKLCRECGRGFQSWKALFGHMKCHSERFSNIVGEDSWTSAGHRQVTDSQSDSEFAASNRRKRSSRRVTTRYTNTTASSSSLSTVSEIEQELEEVAICLMMLSKDVTQWGGLNSVAESSDNNSEFLEAKKSLKFKKLRNGKLESTVLDSEKSQCPEKQSEFADFGFSRKGSKLNKSEVLANGLLKSDNFSKSKVDEYVVELGKNSINETGFDHAELGSKKCSSNKRKCSDSFDPKLGVFDSEKRSKFECTTCNRFFHSYQALGGHRASHKKIKGCFASKTDSSENNSIETEISPYPIAQDKLIKSSNRENHIEQEELAGYGEKAGTSYGSKKSKGHECPICFKVFSSGQALGGHKRSHLIGVSEARSHQTIVIQKPIPEIRDLLDLNLPAPIEEDSNGNGHVGFKPWWVGTNHKHEPLVSMLSS